MVGPISATVAIFSALVAFIKIAGYLAVIGVGWFIAKDIISTVSQWLAKGSTVAFKAVSFTMSYFRSLFKDASKNATPEKQVEYANVKQLLESNNVDSIVFAQNKSGDIVEAAGISAANHPTSVSAEENPENYIFTVTTSGEENRIRIDA